LSWLILGLHHAQLGAIQIRCRCADPFRGQGQQQIPHARAVTDAADELTHHSYAALGGHRAGLHRQVAGQQPQQGGFAGAVRSHQRGDAAVPDAEAHVAQQLATIGQRIRKMTDLEETHATKCDLRPAKRQPGLRLTAGWPAPG